jgi:uncharacterized Zn finger protein
MARYWDDYFFPKSTPRKAKGGIKAQSKRGAFAASWWGKRWQQVIESFNIGARLGRGRSYARSGQVLGIDIRKGIIQAKVQGSRPKPYAVDIELKPISKAGWDQLAKSLSEKAVFAARLLAGEMPEEMEQAFQEAGHHLFPKSHDDLKTECSCPDWSNPCKHIAAVYYLICEELDRDPFLLLRLRGMDRDELLAAMNVTGADSSEAENAVEIETAAASPPEPLPADPGLFWKSGPAADEKPLEVRIPPVAAALTKRLGPFPFWRGKDNFLSAMEEAYAKASSAGLEVWRGNLGENGET